MTRAITEEEFLSNPSARFAEVGTDTFVVERDGKFLAAIVSEADFAALRKAQSRRALAALNRLSDFVEASGATEGELRELEIALDRKA